MGSASHPEEMLRSTVLRITVAEDTSETLGTAFAITPDTLLTNAHVVANAEAESLVLLTGDGTNVHLKQLVVHPNPEDFDLALLYTGTTRPFSILPAATATHRPTVLLTRGYPNGGIADSAELRFVARGRADVTYDGHRIEDAFDLTGDLAIKGYSGAPLFDPNAGAVIGIVSSGYRARERSWAIPLSGAEDWDPLRAALSWNEQHLPRYGAMLNGVGVRLLCRHQVENAVDRLVRSRKFYLPLHVPRDLALNGVVSFLRSSQPVLAIVGDSNVGKTWLLADLANSSLRSPTVLLEAVALDRDAPLPLSTFLRQVIVNALTDTLSFPTAASVPKVEEIAKACSTEDVSLVVLLDGVNEALDVRGFLKNWIPEAIGWCRKHGVRLIISSRPEPWSMIVRAIPEPHQALYWQPPATQQGREQEQAEAEERYLRLAHFTFEEAGIARQRYDIKCGVEEAIGRHPLMYRIARDLELGPIEPYVGRFRLLDEFIDRHTDEAAMVLSNTSPRALRAGLERIAAALSTDGTGSLSWSEAVVVIGQEDRLEALITAGLLQPVGQRVRFTYDQLAEPMRALPEDPTAGIRSIDGQTEPQIADLQESITALLRLEADGQDAAFTQGFADLINQIEMLEKDGANREVEGMRSFTWGYLPLAIEAVYMVRALPRGRSREVGQIFTLLVGDRHIFAEHRRIGTLTRWLAEAPLDIAQRVHMLLEVAPWHSAWPWRWKDWATPTERWRFISIIENDAQSDNLGHWLNALLVESPETVRPILIDNITNNTQIEHARSDNDRGEATISSLCAGILFNQRNENLTSLVDQLMRVEIGNARRLLLELVKDDAERLAGVAISLHADPALALPAAYVLRHVGKNVHGELRNAAAECLESDLDQEPLLALEAAAALRAIDPDHLGAWDHLAAAVESRRLQSGFLLSPVPASRFKYALQLAGRIGNDIACELLQSHDGPAEEQAACSALAIQLMETRRANAEGLGRLAERMLYSLLRDAKYAPWHEFAKRLAKHGDKDARIILIYPTFSLNDGEPSPAFSEIRDVLLEQKLNEGEVEVIVQKLCEWPGDPAQWLPLFYVVRDQAPETADLNLLLYIDFSTSSRSPERIAAAESVLDFWSKVDRARTTPISRYAVAAERRGMPIDQIFTPNFVIALG